MFITKLVEENRGTRVVLVLFRRKNILQKTNHGKTVKECSCISLSLTTARLAQTPDSTIESDEEQFERPQNTEW